MSKVGMKENWGKKEAPASDAAEFPAGKQTATWPEVVEVVDLDDPEYPELEVAPLSTFGRKRLPWTSWTCPRHGLGLHFRRWPILLARRAIRPRGQRHRRGCRACCLQRVVCLVLVGFVTRHAHATA